MHGIPSTRSFGIAPYGCCRLIDNAHCIVHRCRIVPRRVRRLVDAHQRGEREARTGLPDASRDLGADLAIDCQPPGHVTAEMRLRRARDEPDAAPYSLISAEPSADDTECGDGWACELEHGRRSGIEIRIHVAHLRADVAPAVVESARGFPCSVEPP